MLLLTCMATANTPALADRAGCDYWDKFETAEVDARLENLRARWLAIMPSQENIEKEFEEEVVKFTDLGYKNPRRLAASSGEAFFVRSFRLKAFKELYGEEETDQELWTYCLSGQADDCGEFFARYGRPAQFKVDESLAEDDVPLRKALDKLRETVSAFNMYAQIAALTYCDCDGSDEAVAVCKKARSYLIRDF